MNLIDPAIETYAQRFTSEESTVLQQLSRRTHLEVLMPQMLSGNLQGSFLSLLSKLMQPENILEIGTFTGYSAICLAQGLSPKGHLHTLECNEELEGIILDNFRAAGLSEKITLHIGDAAVGIASLPQIWDMVFIDADKVNYALYFDLVIDKVRSGGLIVADNVLWSGKVIDHTCQDKDTVALRAFVDKVHQDTRVENLLLPLRDGLMLALKK
jgi:predicted O-methyltransferase YrrM